MPLKQNCLMTPGQGRGGGGWFGALASLADPPPPTTSEKLSSGKKSKIYQRGRNFEANCRYRNFFWPLTSP